MICNHAEKQWSPLRMIRRSVVQFNALAIFVIFFFLAVTLLGAITYGLPSASTPLLTPMVPTHQRLRIWVHMRVSPPATHFRSERESHASVDRGQHQVTWYWNSEEEAENQPGSSVTAVAATQCCLPACLTAALCTSRSPVCAQSKCEGWAIPTDSNDSWHERIVHGWMYFCRMLLRSLNCFGAEINIKCYIFMTNDE